MIYLFLNIVIFLMLIYYTHLVDTKLKNEAALINSFAVSLLFLLVENGVFILTLVFKNFWIDSLTTQLMKIAFLFDALFFINFSFNLITLGTKKGLSVLRYFFVLLLAVSFSRISALGFGAF